MSRNNRFRPKKGKGDKPRFQIEWPASAIFGMTLGLFVVMTIVGLFFASHVLKPTLTSLAQYQAKQAMTYAFNYSLSQATLKDLATDSSVLTQKPHISQSDFLKINKNNQGKIVLVSMDTAKVSEFLHDKTERLEDFLYALDRGEITIDHQSDHIIKLHKNPVGQSTSIPLGLLTRMPLFGNLGPKAPLRFDFLSSLTTTVQSDVKPAGVNTVHLTLYVQAKTNVHLILPFRTQPVSVEKKIPIAELTVSGDVPDYLPTVKGSSSNQTGHNPS